MIKYLFSGLTLYRIRLMRSLVNHRVERLKRYCKQQQQQQRLLVKHGGFLHIYRTHILSFIYVLTETKNNENKNSSLSFNTYCLFLVFLV